MNSISVQETKRIMAVIDDCIEDIKVIKYLPSSLAQFSPELFKKLGSASQEALKTLYEDERAMESCLTDEKIYDNLSEVIDRVAESVRSVCSSLRKDGFPEKYMKTITSIDAYSSDSVNRFLTVLKELKVVVHGKLTSTVELDKMKHDILNDTAAREKKAKADVKALQKELNSERSIREREVSLREDALNKLKEDLNNIKMESENERREFERIIAEKDALETAEFKKNETFLTEEINRMTIELKKLKEEHVQLENEMKTKRRQGERDVDGWLTIYDKAMEERTQQLIELQTETARAQERVDFLTEELIKFDNERKEREEKERIIREAREREEAERERQRKAAVTIQALWRGYVVRKSFAGKKEKKTAKKKKGAKDTGSARASKPSTAATTPKAKAAKPGSKQSSKPVTPSTTKPSTAATPKS